MLVEHHEATGNGFTAGLLRNGLGHIRTVKDPIMVGGQISGAECTHNPITTVAGCL
jgi:hypothetical protein